MRARGLGRGHTEGKPPPRESTKFSLLPNLYLRESLPPQRRPRGSWSFLLGL